MKRITLSAFLVFFVAPIASLFSATNAPILSPSVPNDAGSSASSSSITATQSSPSPASTNRPLLLIHDLTEIHARIALPKDWTLLPGRLLEGGVLIATREKISGENDAWITGLSMTIDRNGAKDSGQKASAYALGIAREALGKAGEEASPMKESQSGVFHEIRFDFPVAGDPPLQITEVLRANDATGTLAVILWQMPQAGSNSLLELREDVLSGLVLDPSK